MHTCIHVYIYTYMHIYIYTYIRIYIYTYKCAYMIQVLLPRDVIAPFFSSLVRTNLNQVARVLRRLDGFQHHALVEYYLLDVLPPLLACFGTWVDDWDSIKQKVLAHHHVGAAAEPAGSEPQPLADGPRPFDGDGPVGSSALLDNWKTSLERVYSSEKTIRTLKMQVRYWKSEAMKHRRRNKELQHKLDARTSGGKKAPLRKRRGDAAPRYFSVRGGLVMALKRNICNTPTATLGVHLETDVNRTTVSRWEMHLDNCLRSSSVAFYQQIEDELQEGGGFALHSVRSDATNARVWHQEKLHVVEISSTYYVSPLENPSPQESMYLGDLAVIPDGSGVTARGMIEKQMQSTGCPSWCAVLTKLGIAPDPDLPLEQRLKAQLQAFRGGGKKLIIELFVQTTDAGSEQVYQRELVARECSESVFVLAVSGNCMHHQQHLMYKSSLLVSTWALTTLFGESVQYYSALTKVINIWRDCSKAVFLEWSSKWSEEAVAVASRAPGKCLSGRWGSADVAEEKLSKCTASHLHDVLAVVLKPKGQSRRRPSRDAALVGVHEEGMEERKERYGRWGADALEACACNTWWFVLKVSYRARCVIRHLQRSMEASNKKTLKEGEVRWVAELVWSKADKCSHECSSLLNRNVWRDVLEKSVEYRALSPEAKANADSLVVALVLNEAGEYDMRIASRARQYPERWLMLAREGPNVKCRMRQIVCEEVLTMDERDMDLVTLKLKLICSEELEIVRQRWQTPSILTLTHLWSLPNLAR